MSDRTMPDDEFMLIHPRTPEHLAEIRRQQVLHEKEVFGYDVTAYTCDGCSDAPRCLLVFDGYNFDGDCLASK